MKLNKKIFMVSAAALMLVSPVAGISTNVSAVAIPSYEVKKSMKGKLTLNHNSYVYTKSGKRTKQLLRKGKSIKYVGKITVNNTADNLYFFKYAATSDKLQLKPTRIKGKDYFQIGKNKYVNVANVSTVDGSSLFFKQTTVVTKRRAMQMFMGAGSRVLSTGKYYKKGTKLTVDQLGGMNALANYLPNAYHIKGTNYYVMARDVTPRQNMEIIDYDERNLTTVLTNELKVPTYSFNAEVSTPSDYAWGYKAPLAINGAMYLYNDKTQKSELYYHLTDRYQEMDNLKTSAHFPDSIRIGTVNVGDAFVKASDVTYASGIRFKPINTPDEAENNSKIAITEMDEADLKDLVAKADSVKNTIKYKLSSFYKRYNYDQAVEQAQTALNSRKLMSTAEAKYLIWSIKTYESQLDGAKLKVNNMNKLTEDERTAVYLLIDSVYTRQTDTEDLYGSAVFKKKNYKTFTLEIEDSNQNNKVVSSKVMNTSDFVEKR